MRRGTCSTRLARLRPGARRRDHARWRRVRRPARRRDRRTATPRIRRRRAAGARTVSRARAHARAHLARTARVTKCGAVRSAVCAFVSPRIAADRRGRTHACLGRRRLAMAGPVHRAVHARPAEPSVAQLRAASPRRYHPRASTASLASLERQVATEARAYQRTLHTGDPVGRLQIGRIGLNMFVVQGTDHEIAQEGAGSLRAERVARRRPPDLRRRPPHDVPRAVRAHQRHPGRRLHHVLRALRRRSPTAFASLHRRPTSARSCTIAAARSCAYRRVIRAFSPRTVTSSTRRSPR